MNDNYEYRKDDRSLFDKIMGEFTEAWYSVYNKLDYDNRHSHEISTEKEIGKLKLILKPIVKKLTKANPEYFDYLTGIITSHKKFRPIDFVNSKIVKLNEFYKIQNIKENDLFKGQYAHGIVINPNEIYLWNVQPREYCCEMMKDQFSLCTSHGLNCPDHFIFYSNGRYYVEANGSRAISRCPFCGAKLGDYTGLFLFI